MVNWVFSYFTLSSRLHRSQSLGPECQWGCQIGGRLKKRWMNRVAGEEVTERRSILCHPRTCTTTHTHKHTARDFLQGTAALQTPPSITRRSVTASGSCLKPTPPLDQSNLWERDEIKRVCKWMYQPASGVQDMELRVTGSHESFASLSPSDYISGC